MKTRKEVFDNTTLYLGDCMPALAEMTENQFDLAIVDPPYGINMDGGNVGYKGFNDFKKKKWDKEIPEYVYFEQLFKVSTNQIVWGGNYFGLPATRCFLVWDKGEGFYNRTYAECELAWTSFDKNTIKYKWDPLAKGDYRGKIHPTQKPVALYAWILQNHAKNGDKLIDTHMGSGSSVIACLDVGLSITAYEIDEEYFDDACFRIEAHLKKIKESLGLFKRELPESKPKKQKQKPIWRM